MIPVVLDTDIGGDIDDTWALAMLLRCPELDPRLVVTCTGDTTYRARIAAGIMAAGGREEIPIGIGIPTLRQLPYDAEPREFRENQPAFAASVDLDVYRGGVRADGVKALVDCVMSSPAPVTLIATGPLTNIAAGLVLEPAISQRARLVAMLGSLQLPEYNVAADVAACRAVLAAGWEPTIAPLETCVSAVLRDDRWAAIRRATNPLAKAVVANYREWSITGGKFWTETLAADQERSLARIPAEHRPMVDALIAGELFEVSTTTLCDTVAVYLAYDETFLEIKRQPIAVDDEGVMSISDDSQTVRAATSWRNLDAFADQLVERLV